MNTHQDVDAAELLIRKLHHVVHTALLREVSAMVEGLDVEIGLDLLAEGLNGSGVAETVEEDIATSPGKLLGDGKADTGGRTLKEIQRGKDGERMGRKKKSKKEDRRKKGRERERK